MKKLYYILTLFLVVQNAIAIELGSLDASFNGTGWLAEGSDQADHKTYGNDVLVDSQGRVLVAGTEEYQDGFVVQDRGRLMRYDGEGQIDTSFGNSGKVVFENNISLTGIIQMSLGENDSIFIAYSLLVCQGGSDCQEDVFVKYLDNTGTEVSSISINFDLQTTFDRQGDSFRDIKFISGLDRVVIVAAVERIGDNDKDFGIASIDINPNTGDLTLDTSFNGNGKNTCYFDQGGTTSSFGRWDIPSAITFDVNSQNYIITGYAQENNGTNSNGKNMAFCEFALDGSLVSKWSTQASSPFVFDDIEVASDIVAVNENGSTILYVSGIVQGSGNADFALGLYVRNILTGEWELDTTFGSNSGWSYVDFNEFYS